MGITEIILIIAGVIVLALGYLLPARKKDMDEEVLLISEDEVRRMVDREVDGAKGHISDIIDETVTYAIEKTERSMERVANEKIMAVNEYSDTVLEEINKNHKEVLFLYDMLNDKHENLKSTILESAGAAEEVKQSVRDVEITAQELQKSVKTLEITTKEAQEAAQNAVEEVKAYSAALQDEAKYYAESLQNIMTSGAYEERESAAMSAAPVQEKDEELELQLPADDEVLEEEDSLFYDTRQGAETPGLDVLAKNDGFMEYRKAPVSETVRAETESIQDIQEKEDQFVPITPPRVEIIHDVDGDYVAAPPQLEEQVRTKEPRRAARKQAETKPVNIQFTNGRDSGRNNNERILELHKAGKSNMAIAKELGLGIGEVKLVIDLFEGM